MAGGGICLSPLCFVCVRLLGCCNQFFSLNGTTPKTIKQYNSRRRSTKVKEWAVYKLDVLQSLQVSIDWNIEETIRRTQPEKLYIFVCCGFLSPPSSKTLWILILFSIVNCAAEYHTCSSLYLFFKAVSSSYIISPLSQTTTEKCSYNFGFPSSNEKSLFFPPYTLSYYYFWSCCCCCWHL